MKDGFLHNQNGGGTYGILPTQTDVFIRQNKSKTVEVGFCRRHGDDNYAGTILVYKEGTEMPQDPSDGIAIDVTHLGDAYDITGLTNSKTYTIRGFAYNADGEFQTSITDAVATMQPVGILPHQVMVYLVENGSRRAVVGFDTPNGSEHCAGIVLVYKEGTEMPQNPTDGIVIEVGTASGRYTITGLENGKTYTVRGFAYNADREYNTSIEGEVVVQMQPEATLPPQTPVYIDQNGSTFVIIHYYNWGSAHYAGTLFVYKEGLEMPQSPTDGTAIDIKEGGDLFTITGLTNGKVYTIRGFAYNHDGDFNMSIENAVAVMRPSVTLSAQTKITASAGNGQAAVILQTAGGQHFGGTILVYKEGTVMPADDTDGTRIDVGTATSYTITGLTNDTTYSIRAFAYNPTGNLNYETAGATIQVAPVGSPLGTATLQVGIGRNNHPSDPYKTYSSIIAGIVKPDQSTISGTTGAVVKGADFVPASFEGMNVLTNLATGQYTFSTRPDGLVYTAIRYQYSINNGAWVDFPGQALTKTVTLDSSFRNKAIRIRAYYPYEPFKITN